MKFNEYQDFVKTTKVYPKEHSIVYPALGLSGESGEIAEKIKKWLRGDRLLPKEELIKEVGDVLWYCASLADDLGVTFEEVAQINVEKLSSRKDRGVLKGDGDNR
jgi:NTP pyrophosphatase (non-canonical NTP hydrolase)